VSRPDLVATYRLQLTPELGFPQVTRILPYLAELGVSHLYLSPMFEAVRGSTHGYDVVDFGRVRGELGGEQAFCAMADEAERLGLGIVLDIVPHHMSTAGDQNPWWWDVLLLGRASRYAHHFDIDWNPPEEKLRDTVLLPVLGDHYGRVLEAGELRVEWTDDDGSFEVRYHDVVAPLSPTSAGEIVERAAAKAGADELGLVGRALRWAESSAGEDEASRAVRDADVRTACAEVVRLVAEMPALGDAISAELDAINADPDVLDQLLSSQHHRLARWQVASHELDYRRFFDITGLVALRSERGEVFGDTHDLVLRLVAQGHLDGLRVDHADGLADPQGYFERLRGAAGDDIWLLAEKILRPGEHLPESWPIDGTTGYDFLHRAGGVLVDPDGTAKLRAAFGRFTGEGPSYEHVRTAARRAVLEEGLAADLDRVTALLVRVCERHRRYRDFTRTELRDALREVAVHAPAYRSYVRAVGRAQLVATDDDVRFVETAIEGARAERPDLDPELLSLLGDLLCGRVQGRLEAAFVTRFQQLTGPVAAKGEEDTAFYTAVWSVVLNEVGSGPEVDGVEVGELHAENEHAQQRWPRAMLATATHDTKRGEDVRARLALLSEIPDDWEAAVTRWSKMNERHRTDEMPDRATEWLLYQTLIGAHPLPLDRAWQAMEKSIREANVHTSWVRPNAAFEDATRRFVEAVLGDQAFLDDLDELAADLVEPGRVNALALATMKLLAPGVPDVYQGTELWDCSLVDPDNRRPVDYDLRRRQLHDLAPKTGAALWADRDQADAGLPKLFVLRSGLALRRRRPDAFGAESTYAALEPEGDDAAHVIGFVRGGAVAAVVPRLVLGLAGRPPSARVTLPDGAWQHVLTGDQVEGGPVAVDELFRSFPVAILERFL
jgi:(1->4)-alpha-D-glucan 1-alpha-D-glucosylmutase